MERSRMKKYVQLYQALSYGITHKADPAEMTQMAASTFRHAVHGVIEFANQRVDGNCGTVAETPAGGDFFP